MSKDFSEIEMRILSELEEAGEETPAAMLNTVTIPPESNIGLSDYLVALKRLVNLGLIGMASGRDKSNKLSPCSMEDAAASIDVVASHLRFDSNRLIWVDDRRRSPPYTELFPYLIDTEAGRRAGIEVIQNRGYRWWIKTK